jgi:glucose-1-phosphate thymidylyltransferase
VRAVLLNAGYATRLMPLTENVAKALLPIAGRSMTDRLVGKLNEVPELGAIHIVTNSKFAPAFTTWAQFAVSRLPLVIHDDGTSSNDDRLGAIGDLDFVIRHAQVRGEELFVIAGDNLFDFDLNAMIELAVANEPASVVAVRPEPNERLLKQFGVVGVDGDGRITEFVEKPEHPPSDLAATAVYYLHRDHVARIADYLAEGNPPDKIGSFVEWLVPRVPVYAYRFDGEWVDVGDKEQLLEADNRFRRREGLPERSEYTLGT